MREHLLEYEFGLITSLEDPLSLDGYKLLPNVLNSAHQETSIIYQIPKASDVVIEVYNIQGQKLTSFNRSHSTGGKFSLNLNAGNYSNGLFLIALKVEDFYIVDKMVLMK